MKTLEQEVSLVGKCDNITITELRRAPGAVLAMVELGKTFVITRDGKQVAVLSKLPGEQLAMTVDGNGKTSYRFFS